MYFYVVFNSVFGIVKHTAFLYVVGKKRNVQKTFHKCRIYCWTEKPGFLSMKWTARNCKRHKTSCTERRRAHIRIENVGCPSPERGRDPYVHDKYHTWMNANQMSRTTIAGYLIFHCRLLTSSFAQVSFRCECVWILPRSDDGCKRSSSSEIACSHWKNE